MEWKQAILIVGIIYIFGCACNNLDGPQAGPAPRSANSRSQIPLDVWKKLSKINSTTDFIKHFLTKKTNQTEDPPGASDNETISNTTQLIDNMLFPSGASAADSQGADEVADMLSPPEGCKTREVAVAMPKDPSPDVLMWPECVLLHRCSGCCGHDTLECVAREYSLVTVPALKTRYNPVTQNFEYDSYKELQMEDHVSCECRCKVQEHHCDTQKHVYIADSCRCQCINENEAYNCLSNQKWDDYNCACVCRETLSCHDNEYFDRRVCACIRLSNEQNTAINGFNQCRTTVCRAGYMPSLVDGLCKCVSSSQWGQPSAANLPDGVEEEVVVDLPATTTTEAPRGRPRPRPGGNNQLPTGKRRRR